MTCQRNTPGHSCPGVRDPRLRQALGQGHREGTGGGGGRNRDAQTDRDTLDAKSTPSDSCGAL